RGGGEDFWGAWGGGGGFKGKGGGGGGCGGFYPRGSGLAGFGVQLLMYAKLWGFFFFEPAHYSAFWVLR
ncbi:hypothetical protein ACISSW_26790, partial [Escherichia coli]